VGKGGGGKLGQSSVLWKGCNPPRGGDTLNCYPTPEMKGALKITSRKKKGSEGITGVAQ